MFEKFLSDRQGSIAILFGMLAIVLVAAVGFGIDLTRAIHIKSKVQTVVDATALAANYDSNGLSNDKVIEKAEAYFEATMDVPAGYSIEPEVSVNQGKIEVKAHINMPTYFGSLAGIDRLDIDVVSETVIGKVSFDVVMVLDNSGSMGGSKIYTLKQAAKDLSETLFKINDVSEKKDRVKIGLVPFTAFVNVGTDKDDASWMDREGRSPIHWTNFETEANGKPDPGMFNPAYLHNGQPSRFSLYKQLAGTPWRGCVEARPSPYDVTDDPANASNPATMFVPEFAPDEPSENYEKDYDRYYNNYLDDDRGVCSESVNKAYKSSGLPRYEYAQKRICKYNNQKYYYTGTSRGPNYLCTTQPIIPLTTTKNDILNAINSMVANGYTNIHQGVVWGWRVLSPQEPFTGGREIPEGEYRDEDHKRIMIVMTDGANTYENQNSFNRTRIHAYGYGAEQRLGPGIDRANEIEATMDQRTSLACANAKSQGEVDIFTIAFQISDTATVNMMRNCATRPDMAYTASSNAALKEAFERIAEEITKLRLNR
ncbi:TadE/TadG family protein [Stappia sp. F7233]|uniref:TadE/TadG family protein n=1 Tax=Stappia albiluteola TaxID=2758565 RepID=A0A839AJR9_9HYPH|nr:pilus assembly protein TadG-related protein [Stappia albiluteola]MBA5779017.1 TadE/TadG family protein [Stappia albiluteola]